MKLAKIEHSRCGEPISWRGGDGYTYLWVPDDMTAEELDSLCEEAQKSYLDIEREFNKMTPVSPPGYGAKIMPSDPDNKTVGELRAEYDAQEKAYKEYHAMMDKSRKPFASHLNQVSGGTVLQFWEHRPDGYLEVELSWGHNHGVTIDHSPTVMGDYPFPEDEGAL